MKKTYKVYNVNSLKKGKTKRIWELDMLRGFAILMVFFDHLLYDFAIIFNSWGYSNNAFLNTLHSAGMSYIFGDIRSFWRPAFLFLFVFTSGLCTAFSRDNFLRGIKLLFCAILISFVTYYISTLYNYDIFILFGILHCLSIIILIYALVEFIIKLLVKLFYKLKNTKFDKNVYQYILSIICLILSVIFLYINEKYNVKLYDATTNFKTINTNSKLLGMFFYVNNWWTADYFPLFPFISFFFLGAGLTKFLYPKKKTLLPCLDSLWHKVFTFPGKYSIVFYLCGQIVALSFCYLCSLICGVPI